MNSQREEEEIEEFFIASSSEAHESVTDDSEIPLNKSYAREFFTPFSNIFVGRQLVQITTNNFSSVKTVPQLAQSLFRLRDKEDSIIDYQTLSRSSQFFTGNQFKKLFTNTNNHSFSYVLIEEKLSEMKFLSFGNEIRGEAVNVMVPDLCLANGYDAFVQDVLDRNRECDKKIIILKDQHVQMSSVGSAYISFEINRNFIVFKNIYYNTVDFFHYIEISIDNLFSRGSCSHRKYDVRSSQEPSSALLFVYSDSEYRNTCSSILTERIKIYTDGIENCSTGKIVFHDGGFYYKPCKSSTQRNNVDYLCYISSLPSGKYLLNQKTVYEIVNNQGISIAWEGIDYSKFHSQ